MIYICEYCKKEYRDITECEECEIGHRDRKSTQRQVQQKRKRANLYEKLRASGLIDSGRHRYGSDS